MLPKTVPSAPGMVADDAGMEIFTIYVRSAKAWEPSWWPRAQKNAPFAMEAEGGPAGTGMSMMSVQSAGVQVGRTFMNSNLAINDC